MSTHRHFYSSEIRVTGILQLKDSPSKKVVGVNGARRSWGMSTRELVEAVGGAPVVSATLSSLSSQTLKQDGCSMVLAE